MPSVNKVQLIGNVGHVEVRTFDGGEKVVNATLATSERYKNRSGEWVESTDWHDLVIGGVLAGVADKLLTKGMMIYVEGKLKQRSYTNRDGNKVKVVEVRVHNLQILTPKAKAGNTKEAPEAVPEIPETTESVGVDDLPF